MAVFKVGQEWSHDLFLTKHVEAGRIQRVTTSKEPVWQVMETVQVTDPNHGFTCSDHGDAFTLKPGNRFKVVRYSNPYRMAQIRVW